jgi:hypothetical protein
MQTKRADSSAAVLQNLVGAMGARGFDQPLIEKVCLKNLLRLLGRTSKGGSGNGTIPVRRYLGNASLHSSSPDLAG